MYRSIDLNYTQYIQMLQNICKGDIKIRKEQKKQAEYRYMKS